MRARHRHRLRACVVLAFTTMGGSLAAAPDRPPAVEAARRAGPIRVDALLDEPDWQRALVIDDFVQQLPEEGVPPSERTVARILYDEEALYIGIVCHDRDPSAIRIGSLLRDSFNRGGGEVIAFAIDSSDSGRDGFWFSVNAGGAQADSQIFDEGRIFDPNWDGIWESAGRIGPEGWTVEVRLPFHNLNFREAPENVMRINFFRAIQHKNEEIYAPFIPRNYNGTFSFSLGRPVVLRGIRRGARLGLKPYGLVAASRQPYDSDVTGEAGVDLKWGVTPNFTADFTVNPDFAQAEADVNQVNLSRFPLFFPEKREFFLESAGLFDFGAAQSVQAFFSRRIGLDGEGNPVPLLGGARLTGRSGPWSLGVLDAMADETDGEPGTNFAVARLRRDIGTRSTVGAILTEREASGPGGGNRVLGADTRLVFGEDVFLEGFAMGSRTSGPDGDGYAGRLTGRKAGDLWRWETEVGITDEGFDPGVGFVRRTGVQHAGGYLVYRPRPAGIPAVRQFEFGGSVFYQEARTSDPAWDGRILDREWALFHETEFESGDGAEASIERRLERLTEPFEIFTGVLIPAGDYDQDLYVLEGRAWRSRRISGGGAVGHGAFFGGRRTIMVADLRVRVNEHLALETSWEGNRVRLPYGDFDTNLAVARIEYGFTPRLFGSALVQWNDVTDDLDLNLRLDFIHHPGADLFVVYNQSTNTDRQPGEPVTNQRQAIVKLTWLFQF